MNTPVDFDDESSCCWRCGGDGVGIIGVDWDADDPINGPYDGELEVCDCCDGSGLATDCRYW